MLFQPLAITAIAVAMTMVVEVNSMVAQKKRDVCSGNTATDRATWCDYDLDTNYYTEWPDTGVTREYWFTVEQITAAPDGIDRVAYAINGSIPGPTIYADWGD
jgi:hypothetical protein